MGLLLRGEQYVAAFAHWYDDLWASISDMGLVYSRNGIDEKAMDRIRKELEAGASITERQTA